MDFLDIIKILAKILAILLAKKSKFFSDFLARWPKKLGSVGEMNQKLVEQAL